MSTVMGFQGVEPETLNLNNLVVVMVIGYNFKLGLRMSFKSL